jgi:hypothetical protein
MSLNSFGAILSFAEELESQKKQYYETAAQKIDQLINNVGDHAGAKELFESLGLECAKQIKLIKRTRQENVTEMILEPVKDFFKESFVMDVKVPDQAAEILLAAKKNEETGIAFYTEAALKLKALLEVSRILKQLAKKQRARLERLNLIGESKYENE